MKTNFKIKEVKIGDEVRMENLETEVIYSPQEFVETIKSLKEIFGTDIINKIAKVAILGNME